MGPKVAVVIPVYNGIGIVDNCIKGVVAQTAKVSKIICVDDASPDNSASYTKKRFPFVKVLRNKQNIGASGTYAVGIRYALEKNFDYIWLLDQDDVPFKNALGELLKCALKEDKKIFVSTLINKTYKIVYPMLSRAVANCKNFYEVDVANFAGLLLPTSLLKIVGLPITSLTMDAADWEYCLRIRKAGYKIIVNPLSIAYHRTGDPILIRMPFKRIRYKLVGKRIEAVKTDIGVTSTDNFKRYFLRGKNCVVVAKLSYADRFLKFYLGRLLIKHVLNILLYQKYKKKKLVVFLSGILSGITTSSAVVLREICEQKRDGLTKLSFEDLIS